MRKISYILFYLMLVAISIVALSRALFADQNIISDNTYISEGFAVTVKIESVTLKEDGTLEVIEIVLDRNDSTPLVYGALDCWHLMENVSYVASKYIYGVKNGRIVLLKTITGTYYPETVETKTVPERFDWQSEDNN